MTRLAQHLRYALRQIKKSLAFSALVIGTLALGLGATAAMFTIVDRVMLRPLPYEKADQLVTIHETGRRGQLNGSPFLDIQQWIERSHTLDEIAFYSPDNHGAFLNGKTARFSVRRPASGSLDYGKRKHLADRIWFGGLRVARSPRGEGGPDGGVAVRVRNKWK